MSEATSKKSKPTPKHTCGDCVHRWACAAQRGGGGIVSMMETDAKNCVNFRYEIVHTNADRIRSMSDEELAKEMLFFVPSDFKKHYTGLSGGYFATADEAIQASLYWLRQPVKEEHHEAD